LFQSFKPFGKIDLFDLNVRDINLVVTPAIGTAKIICTYLVGEMTATMTARKTRDSVFATGTSTDAGVC